MNDALFPHLVHLMIFFLRVDGILPPEGDMIEGAGCVDFVVDKVGPSKVLIVLGEHIPRFLQELMLLTLLRQKGFGDRGQDNTPPPWPTSRALCCMTGT